MPVIANGLDSYIIAMRQIANRQSEGWSDKEGDHSDADDILRKALVALGASELVVLFDKIEKWYA